MTIQQRNPALRRLCPIAASFCLLLASASAAAAASAYIIYPSKGQGLETQAADEAACRTWAQQQTGFDPTKGPVHVQTVQTGGEVARGAARGATVGVVGGLIGGDVGKGAAIGAGVGATSGLMRRTRKQSVNAQMQQQAAAEYNAGLAHYDRAFAACMQGRGYAVN